MDLNLKLLFAYHSYVYPLSWAKFGTFSLLKEHIYMFKGSMSPISHGNFGYKLHLHISRKIPKSSLQVNAGLTESCDATTSITKITICLPDLKQPTVPNVQATTAPSKTSHKHQSGWNSGPHSTQVATEHFGEIWSQLQSPGTEHSWPYGHHPLSKKSRLRSDAAALS